MTDSPLISIIVPVYNNAAEADRCLQSLYKSELRDRLEIIVIDDCSSEEGLIQRTAQKYKARLYRQDKNAGPGVARNRGALEARGSILVFIDSDCVAPDGWLSRLVQPIRDGMHCATMSCYYGPVMPTWITIFQDEDYKYRMPSVECDTSFVNSCNFAIDRNVFLELGGFPKQRISEDFVLGLLLSERGTPTRFLPYAGVLHSYYGSIKSYLRQRFSFAFNTIRSYLTRNKIRTKKANENARSFNPVRTAVSMFFTSIALMSFPAAVIAVLWRPALVPTAVTTGVISLLLETITNGRFLVFLMKRHGIVNAVSYIPLLYLIDIAYIWGVLRGLMYWRSS